MTSLEDYANSSIEPFIRKTESIFDQSEKVSKVYGELKEKDQYVAIIKSDKQKFGLATIPHLLGVTQPSQSTIGDYPKDRWTVYPTVPPTATILEVTDKIEQNRVRALPVLEGGEPIGVISQVEITWGLENVPEMRHIPAIDLMEQPVITLKNFESVAKARRTMLDEGISHIPIVNEENRPIGMIRAKELVYKFVRPIGEVTTGDRLGDQVPRWNGRLSQVMDHDHDLVTVDPEASAHDVVTLMKDRNSSYCLVLDRQGFIAGIITPKELMAPILRFLEEERLPVYIMGLTAEEDWFNTTIAEDKVRRLMTRAQRIHPHISEVRVNVEKQRGRGTRTRYEVKGNIYTKAPGETIHVSEEGWDLLQVFDQLVDAMDKMIRDQKHEPRRIDRYKPLNRRNRRRR
jgi:CBS domain-containing protein/ribosome-associated translation inhibitor RaiA